MQPVEIIMIVLTFLVPIVILGLFIRFGYRLKNYKFIGNVYVYIITAYLICLALSLVVNFNPQEILVEKTITVAGESKLYSYTDTNVSFSNPFEVIVVSLFDALKMMAVAFDRAALKPYQNSANGWYNAFSWIYYISSAFALLATSISVIMFFSKSFIAKLRNIIKSICGKNKVYYIFSNSRVAGPTKKLGTVLRDKGNIVIIYVSKASLKTQEGTEYRDSLINDGFDVRSEGYSKELCKFLFKKYFNRRYKKFLFFPWPYRNRQVTIFGLFPDDDSSIDLASKFREGIENNKFFKKHFIEKYINGLKKDEKGNYIFPKDEVMQEDIKNLSFIRIFITYQDYDIDLPHNFSGRTMHIINTLSQYDMVSSEFLLNNQLMDFVSKKDEEGNKVMVIDDSNKDAFHVSFFGFGNINRPIFEKMTYAYQLWDDDSHKINYHIYDYKAKEIVEKLSNEYINDVKQEKGYLEKPLLYKLDYNCDGKDLTSYEILNSHFSSLKNDSNRFNENGFEIFVVSAATTNQDIQIAFNLRRILLKTFTDKPGKLNKAFIFVRVGDEVIADNLIKGNEEIVFKQEDFDVYTNRSTNPVPIIIFGENTNLADFIEHDYYRLVKQGEVSLASYCGVENNYQSLIYWLMLNKTSVLTNTATTYSFETKLALLGYELDDNGYIIDAKTKENVTAQQYEKSMDDMYKRVKAIYPKIDKSEPITKLAMLEHNRWIATSYSLFQYAQMEKMLYTKNSRTKSAGETRHICMTTNRGLIDLYNHAIKQGKAEGDIKKTVLENDIDATIAMFKTAIK